MWLSAVGPGEREAAALGSAGRLELLAAGITPGAAQWGPGRAQQSRVGHPQVLLLLLLHPVCCAAALKCQLTHFGLAAFILKLL